MDILPRPQVLRSFAFRENELVLSALELSWSAEAPGSGLRTWHFPNSIRIQGPPPRQFGVTIRRLDVDCYAVRMLWNEVCLSWNNLKRVQILASALSPVLKALGTDLWPMLEQQMDRVPRSQAA